VDPEVSWFPKLASFQGEEDSFETWVTLLQIKSVLISDDAEKAQENVSRES